MTMIATPGAESSASKFKDLAPVLIGEEGTTSIPGFDVQPPNPSNPWIGYQCHAWSWIRSGRDETVRPVTICTVDAVELFDSGHPSAVFDSNGPVRTKSQSYFFRINTLRLAAAQDGYSLNSASEFDFWRFIGANPRLRKGNLVLIDNGNLRAVWRDEQKTHLGLQFLGEGMVQYVIFKRREAARPISRVAGRDTFEGIKQQIQAFELHSLFYE